jgi:transposase
VFDDLAARGKTSVDWFFGFKLHLVVNEEGELLNVHLTPGNVDDRKPVNKLLQSLVKPDSFIDVISRKIS